MLSVLLSRTRAIRREQRPERVRVLPEAPWHVRRKLQWEFLRAGAGYFCCHPGGMDGYPSVQCGQSQLANGPGLSNPLSVSLHPTPLPCWRPAHRQTAPYGLGNPPRRWRRSLPRRCECYSARDPAHNFLYICLFHESACSLRTRTLSSSFWYSQPSHSVVYT